MAVEPGKEKGDAVEPGFHTLIVDDEHLYAQAIGEELQRSRVACDLAFTAAQALDLARSQAYRAILLDHKLPDDDGIRIIPILLARQPGAVLIMMTAFETIPNAIQAIRQGAEDYLVKQPTFTVAQYQVTYTSKTTYRVVAWSDFNQTPDVGRHYIAVAIFNPVPFQYINPVVIGCRMVKSYSLGRQQAGSAQQQGLLLSQATIIRQMTPDYGLQLVQWSSAGKLFERPFVLRVTQRAHYSTV